MSVRTCSEKGSHYSITRIHLFPRGIGNPTCGHAPCRDDAMDGVIGDNGGTFRSQICSWGSWTLTGTVAPCCERFRAWSCFFRITLSSAGKALQIIQTSPAARVPILFEPIASTKCRQCRQLRCEEETTAKASLGPSSGRLPGLAPGCLGRFDRSKNKVWRT